MSRGVAAAMVVVVVAMFIALTTAQGFYSQRYGKRSDTPESTVRSGFYANRYGRSSPTQGLPEIKIRSSRFIGGSRYGKRAGPVDRDIASLLASQGEDGEEAAALLVGDSMVCIFVDVPNIYRCIRKSSPEETSN